MSVSSLSICPLLFSASIWLVAGSQALAASLPSQCGSGSYSRQINVDSASELENALNSAKPGDLIMLADGTYKDRFKAGRDGSSSSPITVCGTRKAVLDGGSYKSGYGFHLTADHYILHGFTVQNSNMGIVLDGANDNMLRSLEVKNTGQEGIHFRTHSSNNTLRGSTVRNTGLKVAGYGEGIYVGSAKSNWDRYTGGQPDRSDNNKIINNYLTGITAEHIDIKEGTRGTLVESNKFDGTAISGDHYADSWVDIKGNDVIIRGNHGYNNGDEVKDGYQTHVQLSGWGSNITFEKNTMEVNGPGYGIWIHGDSNNITITCDNSASGASKGVANQKCSGTSSWSGDSSGSSSDDDRSSSDSSDSSDSGSSSDSSSDEVKNYASMSHLIWNTDVDSRTPIDNLFEGCLSGDNSCTAATLGEDDLTVVFDLGAIRSLQEVRLFGDSSGNWVSEAVDVEVKNKGAEEYSSVYSGEDAKVNDWVELDMSGTQARYVRIRIHHPSGFAAQARELQIYAGEGGSIETLSSDSTSPSNNDSSSDSTSTPTDDSSSSSSSTVKNFASMSHLIWNTDVDPRNPVDNLFDGCIDGNNDCSAATLNSDDLTTVYDLGKVRNLRKVRVVGDSTGNWVSTAIDVEIKDRGSDSYLSILSGADIFSNDWREFDLSGHKGRYIRVRIHNRPGYSAQARELEVLAED